MDWGLLALPGFLIWFIILVLPWRPWSTRESLEGDTHITADLSRITVLIPARNEEACIAHTLNGLKQQGNGFVTILINDQSEDATAAVAGESGLDGLTVIQGKPLPNGWNGKLWALEQGLGRVDTELVLLLDADIHLDPGTMATLMNKLERQQLAMVSLMASLRMQNFWEKMLMPAFIFFFKLLYPFQLSNSASGYVAAAAGGCILVRREALVKAGAFASLRHCLIDDCALARRIKNNAGRIWTGLTHSAQSRRRYDKLQTISDMITRTAFTQLAHSWLMLLLCTVLMIPAFAFPIVLLVPPFNWTDMLALVTLAMMFFCYLPVLRYYSLHPGWACALPVIGLVYLSMTWLSAGQFLLGKGSRWKDRHYSTL
ncbi:MAG TPA: glycosyltransferase [Gammaproteobacteria bacterium]|nr:glycosyltransferase [Gammaproteobacteria bacterium]